MTSICSAGNQPSDKFSIHSIGKVFTGILAMRMLSEGVISEIDFAENPIQLDQKVNDTLDRAPKVRDRLKEITLHQALTHHAGLGVGEGVPSGDYMANYGHDIESGNTKAKDKIADFLPYIFNQVSTKDEHHYSNTGMLIGGLSLEYLYDKHRLEHPDKKLEQLDFNGLMQKYVIEPAGLSNFQNNPLDNFKYNKDEPNAKSFTSGPSGGSFTTANDLERFGKWLYEECRKQPGPSGELALMDLIKKYGQEFFHDDKIAHPGDAPSGSAYFSLNLQTGNIVIVLNDQKRGAASEVGYAIEDNIFSKEREIKQDKELCSTAIMAKQLDVSPASFVSSSTNLEDKQTKEPLAAPSNDTSIQKEKKSPEPSHPTPKPPGGK